MHIKVSSEQAEQALNILAQKVYNPIFFSKLASLGIPVNNTNQAEQLLKLAYTLKEEAVQRFGSNSIDVSVEPAYVDAAKEFIESDKQVKAAAFVYHSLNVQGGV